MCKNPNTPYLVGIARADKRAIVFKADCDSWDCAECAERKRAKWVARTVVGCQAIRSSGMGLRFITLTSHERLSDFRATAFVFPKAWARLYPRMKRKKSDMSYLMVMEKHKSSRLHCHMITDCPVLTRWVKDNARACGLGYEAESRILREDSAAAAYVSKYLGKSFGDAEYPRNFRRVRCSETWAKLPELHEPSADYDWLSCLTPSSLWAACEECQRLKCNMVEMRTGEIFDYSTTVDAWVATF